MATINYTRKIELKYWCVSLEDIKKISDIILKRTKTNQKFSAGFKSGLNIETTNISEFLIALESKSKEKEILEEIKIYSSKSNQGLEKRKTILLKLDFNYAFNWSSCNIYTEDKDGLLKDWCLGTYDEINNFIKSLEIEDKYKNYYEKHAKNKLLFDPFGEFKNEIINSAENSTINVDKNDFKEMPNKNINFLIKYKKLIIPVIIAIIGVIIGGAKFIFNIKFVDSVSKNNVFSENQTGGITAGGDVNVYQQVTNFKNLNVSNLPSAFSFLDRIGEFDTTLERDNYIKNITGMEVGDSGYIDDISSNFDPTIYNVFITKTEGASKFIMCKTDEKNKNFALLSKSSKSIIKFKGKITSGQVLDSCEFSRVN